MANITLTIPAGTTQRVLDGFAKSQGYASLLPDGSTNPETKTQFIKRKLKEYVMKAVRDAEMEDAINIAATAAATSVDTDIVIT